MPNPPKKIYIPIPLETEKIGKLVLDAAYKVHTVLGPGLLESVYQIREVAMRNLVRIKEMTPCVEGRGASLKVSTPFNCIQPRKGGRVGTNPKPPSRRTCCGWSFRLRGAPPSPLRSDAIAPKPAAVAPERRFGAPRRREA